MDVLDGVFFSSLVVSIPSAKSTEDALSSAAFTEKRPTLMSVLDVTWKRPTVVVPGTDSGPYLGRVWDLWTVFSGLETDGDEDEEDDVEVGVMEEEEATTAGSGALPESWSLATDT